MQIVGIESGCDQTVQLRTQLQLSLPSLRSGCDLIRSAIIAIHGALQQKLRLLLRILAVEITGGGHSARNRWL
jgi:hypothetical protein